MIGIYKITNNITNQSYIGQSKDIDQRFKEHCNHKNTVVGADINLYGVENFSFEILEICAPEKLDEREVYYIEKYNTYNTGYNKSIGGSSLPGEFNPNAKLTSEEVYYIRECYANHLRKREVYELFKDKISWLYFSNLWEGQSWKHVHYDVYIEENKEYYSRDTCIGQQSEKAAFTNLEVFEMRKRYINETAEQIYESVKDRCSLQTLKMILWGRHYSQIIVYDKRNEKWIRK